MNDPMFATDTPDELKSVCKRKRSLLRADNNDETTKNLDALLNDVSVIEPEVHVAMQ